MNIMIIEDDVLIQKWLTMLLEQNTDEAITVRCYADGEQGIQALAAERPDLVVTDIKMPKRSGLEVIDHIREQRLGMPVVVLSSYDDFGLVKQALKSGAADYILKPELSHDDIQNLLSIARRSAAAPPVDQPVTAPVDQLSPREEAALYYGVAARDLPEAFDGWCTRDFSILIHNLLSIRNYQGMYQSAMQYIRALHARRAYPIRQLKVEIFQIVNAILCAYNLSQPDMVEPLALTRALEEILRHGRADALEAHLERYLMPFIEALESRKLPLSPSIEAACLYIQKGYQGSLTLDEIARHVNLNRTYLSTLFKKEAGITLTEYIERFRLEKAKDLLASTGLSIAEVTFACGYGAQNYFSKIFKRHTGLSPSEYRQALKQM